MKVIIDGIEYVPVSKASPCYEDICKALLSGWWGEYAAEDETWKRHAADILVDVSDSLPPSDGYLSVSDIAAEVIKRMK